MKYVKQLEGGCSLIVTVQPDNVVLEAFDARFFRAVLRLEAPTIKELIHYVATESGIHVSPIEVLEEVWRDIRRHHHRQTVTDGPVGREITVAGTTYCFEKLGYYGHTAWYDKSNMAPSRWLSTEDLIDRLVDADCEAEGLDAAGQVVHL